MAETYVRNMLSQGLGIPCWDYSPKIGISCGDIGTYTNEGGFKKIWNLWEMEGVVRRALGVDLNTQGAPWPKRVQDTEFVWGLGNSLAVGANVQYTKPYTNDCLYKFTTTVEEGGVLAILDPAYRFNLTQQSQDALKDFIIHYAEALYRWTVELHRQPLPARRPIYIVTGYYKSASTCAKVSFTGQPVDRAFSLKGIEDTAVRKRKRLVSEQLTYDWRAEDDPRSLTMKLFGDESAPEYLFLQGFSLLSSEGSERTTQPHTSSGLRPGTSSSGGIRLAPSLVSWPESVQHNNPPECINRLILDQTISSFALIHDDDWRFLLKGNPWGEHGLNKLLHAMDERSPVVTNSGVSHFKSGWVDDLRQGPTDSHREDFAMAVDDDDEGVRRQAKRLRSDGPYPPPPPTDAEFELGEKIFEAITGEKRRSVPVRIAMDCIECTQFEKDKFRVYLNLTRGRDWGIRDGDMSIDMLIFALRAAAHTVNAKHKVWSTLDAPGSMPAFRTVHSVEMDMTIVQLTFSP